MSNETSSAPDLAADGPEDLAQAIRLCGRDPLLLAGLAEVYRQVDAEAAAAGVACLGGGSCCRFDLAGHRLYLSTGELAFLRQAPAADLSRCRRRRCPYQVGPRCAARSLRPLGCRLYFCRAPAADWSSDLYEKHHRAIRLLHQERRAPYRYVDLTAGLEAAAAADAEGAQNLNHKGHKEH